LTLIGVPAALWLGLFLLTFAPAAGQPAATGAIHGAIHAHVPDSLGSFRSIALANFSVILEEVESQATLTPVVTDIFGRFVFSSFPLGHYRVCWAQTGWQPGCTLPVESTSTTPALHLLPILITPTHPANAVWGRAAFSHGAANSNTPWFHDERFHLSQLVTVTLLNSQATPVGLPILTNAWGEYVIVNGRPAATKVRVDYGSHRHQVDLLAGSPTVVILPNTRPAIKELEPRDPLLGIDAAYAPPPASGGTHFVCTENFEKFTPGATIVVEAEIDDIEPGQVASRICKWDVSRGSGTLTYNRTRNCDSKVGWTLPITPGWQRLYFYVNDQAGGYATDSLLVETTTASNCPAEPSTTPDHLPLLVRKGVGSVSKAKAYYGIVDPYNRRTTLSEWWAVNGFDPQTGENGITASFLNHNELGLGRDMHCLQRGPSTVACYVTNYGDPDRDRQNGLLAAGPMTGAYQAGATVAMEYSPLDSSPGLAPIVKFFAFRGGEGGGNRIHKVELDFDQSQDKHIPHLCLNCHGGRYDAVQVTATGNLNASFLPFRLSSYRYQTGCAQPGNCPQPSPEQQVAFRQLNRLIAATEPAMAIKEILGTATGAAATGDLGTPAGWRQNSCQEALYANVVSRSCATCHFAFRDVNPLNTTYRLDFSTYQDLINSTNGIKQVVFTAGNRKMPHAPATYWHFWESGQASILENHVFTAASRCP
jgi:hypothetical protein